MAQSDYTDPPKSGTPEFDEYMLKLHDAVFGLGEDTTGALDVSDNILNRILASDEDVTITGEFTFSTHPLGLDHTQVSNIGTNTHVQIDAHIVAYDAHIVDYNAHVVTYDAHVAEPTIHFLEGAINHAAITNLTWSTAGHTIDSAFDLAGNNIKNANFLEIDEITTPVATADHGKVYTKADSNLYFQDGAGVEHLIHGFPTVKSYHISTQDLGAADTHFVAGYLFFSAADANLTQAALTQTFGTSTTSYAAHAFAVAGGAGVTDGTTLTLTVTGTSIDDDGNRVGSDSEVLCADCTTLSVDDKLETTKKWLGQVTYTLASDGVNFNLDFNYGLVKYDDFNNTDFTITGVEAVGKASRDDTIDIQLLHWRDALSYSAAAFDPVTDLTINSLLTDHTATNDNVEGVPNDEYFAWKRADLSTSVSGSGLEGAIIGFTTGAVNTIAFCNIHLSVGY